MKLEVILSSPRRRRHFAATASHILSICSQPFFEARRRHSNLRHGGHEIFVCKLQF
jgi:hypothetical protein